jgi:hypothetical protein
MQIAAAFDVTQFPTVVALDAQGSVITYMHPQSVSEALATLAAVVQRPMGVERDILDAIVDASGRDARERAMP